MAVTITPATDAELTEWEMDFDHGFGVPLSEREQKLIARIQQEQADREKAYAAQGELTKLLKPFACLGQLWAFVLEGIISERAAALAEVERLKESVRYFSGSEAIATRTKMVAELADEVERLKGDLRNTQTVLKAVEESSQQRKRALGQAEADIERLKGERDLLAGSLVPYAILENWIPETLPSGKVQWGWVPKLSPQDHPAGVASKAIGSLSA